MRKPFGGPPIRRAGTGICSPSGHPRPVSLPATESSDPSSPERVIIGTLKQRLHASLLRPTPDAADLETARRLAASVGANGAWPDVDYPPVKRHAGQASEHLERVLALARARSFCAGELDGALTRACDFWLARDFQTGDWRHHQIDVPQLVGAAAFLCEGSLSAGARGKVIEILARSRWSHWTEGGWKDRTGADLLRVAHNVLLRGCLENIPALCQEACERVYREVRVVPAGEDGLQADMSFHQGGALLHSGSGGLAFAEAAAQFFLLTHGTPWQAPADCLRLFAAFLLDGQQWMIRADGFDLGTAGGETARAPGGLRNFGAAIEQLADMGITPRRAELAAFARRLRGTAEPSLQGHRHYWHSDFAVHHRPAFYTSVRMSSRRTLAAGSDAEGNQPAHHAADGLTCIVRDGGEYRDVPAVWDWRRLPGTTAVQTAASPDGRFDGHGSAANFVGGVSDGEYGVAVMDLRRDSLRARKAWFYFDESFVCLGNGIGCDDAAGPVFTSINQCALRGPVVAHGKPGESHVLAPGKSYDLSAAYRLEHDGVVYHFPESMPVRARLAPQSNGQTTREVFSVWIDHGVQPGGGEAYAYTVVPGGSTESRAAVDYELAQIKILANTPALQAVSHRALRLVGIVFWEPGIITVPSGGRVAVNRPCVVLCQDRRPDGMRLSIANPTNTAATIHAEYANRCLCFELPGGPQGGHSVSRVL